MLEQYLGMLLPEKQWVGCQVEIAVDYGKRQFSIQSLQNSSTINVYQGAVFNLKTIIRRDNKSVFMNSVSTKNVLQVKCDTENWCDRRFILEHISWLVNSSHKDVERALSPFLISESQEIGKYF